MSDGDYANVIACFYVHERIRLRREKTLPSPEGTDRADFRVFGEHFDRSFNCRDEGFGCGRTPVGVPVVRVVRFGDGFPLKVNPFFAHVGASESAEEPLPQE